MKLATASSKVYLLACALFFVSLPIAFIGAEIEKDGAAARSKSSELIKATAPTTEKSAGDKRRDESKTTDVSSFMPTPEEGYATVAFNWLKSPASLWGWLRAIEIMMVPGLLYIGMLVIDMILAKVRNG